MKLRFILSAFAALLLVSCSSDDSVPTPVPVPETLDTYLSFAASNGKILTKGEITDPDKATKEISTITVAAFRGEPTALANQAANEAGTAGLAAEKKGALLYMQTFKVKDAATSTPGNIVAEAVRDEKGNVEITGIKLKGGNVDFLIMANLPQEPSSIKNRADLENWAYGDLSQEGLNYTGQTCSMSSEWISVSLTPSKDNEVLFIHYGGSNKYEANAKENDANDLIPLTRNVSAICFSDIVFNPAPSWGGTKEAVLTLKRMFVTNVVSKTSLIAPSTFLNDWSFYCGGTEEEAGIDDEALKTVKNTANKLFSYTGFENYTLKKNEHYNKNSERSAVGNKFFMVYENSTSTKRGETKSGLGEGEQTLLTLVADYKYTDSNGKEQTIEDCYYTVVVNDPNGDFDKGSQSGGIKKLIERNYVYYIALTVQGPGSKKPFDPLYSANATAVISASQWGLGESIGQVVE
ncbi:hypothetical protein [Parabacteroides sp.]